MRLVGKTEGRAKFDVTTDIEYSGWKVGPFYYIEYGASIGGKRDDDFTGSHFGVGNPHRFIENIVLPLVKLEECFRGYY